MRASAECAAAASAERTAAASAERTAAAGPGWLRFSRQNCGMPLKRISLLAATTAALALAMSACGGTSPSPHTETSTDTVIGSGTGSGHAAVTGGHTATAVHSQTHTTPAGTAPTSSGSHRTVAPTPSDLGYHPVVYQWGQYGGGRGSWLTRLEPGSPTGLGPVRRIPQIVYGIHGTVVQVATSNSDDYALTRGGVVYAWGAGGQGELGNGTRPKFTSVAVRVDLPNGVKIAKLSNPMPYDGGMAITRGGRVYAWGNDQNQQFCQPLAGILTLPVRVPLTHVILADGALRHTVYYTHGHVVSCGIGPAGQLGDGTAGRHTQTGTPSRVLGLPAGRVVALESSWGNAGALMRDGTYYDWGYNRAGQVGDGSTINARRAVQVALDGPVKSVFQGGSFGNNGQTLVLLRDGELWEWGNGRFGQMGNGSLHSALSPIRLNAPALADRRIVRVASGGLTNYAVGASGRLWSWGDNLTGELGIGSVSRRSARPVRVPITVSQISSTAHNTVALGL